MPPERTVRAVAAIAFAFLGAACSVLGAPSKIRSGDLFASGSPRYDGYFGEVHAQQVAAKAWPDERKTARKPLVDALRLTGDADDVTIAQSTKDRLSSGVLRLEVRGTEVHIVETAASHHDSPQDVLAALEQAANAEIARSAKLADIPARASVLAKTGHELESHIAEDFAGEGQKPFDVREELHASFEVLQAIGEAAQRERRTADQFVAELGRAVSTGSEVPITTQTKPKPTPPPAKPEAPPPKPKPAPKPTPPPAARTEPVAAAPKPAPPKPPRSDANEVFNP
jgi:hypothetical protein